MRSPFTISAFAALAPFAVACGTVAPSEPGDAAGAPGMADAPFDAASTEDASQASAGEAGLSDEASSGVAGEASSPDERGDASGGVDADASTLGSMDGDILQCEGPKCATPVFTPPGGKLPSVPVTISSAGLPADGVIYYTTDGSLPTHASPVYTSPIVVSGAETIRALAYARCECADSAIGVAAYSVASSDGGSPD